MTENFKKRIFSSQAGHSLKLFSYFSKIEPRCSYKVLSLKIVVERRRRVAVLSYNGQNIMSNPTNSDFPFPPSFNVE